MTQLMGITEIAVAAAGGRLQGSCARRGRFAASPWLRTVLT
jgi:hypothetical protein